MIAPSSPLVTFLLVDDLDENLLALEAVLRREGLQLLRAKSGREALELLLIHDIALALIDVQMPEMDGFELAELMRGTERTRRVPIIFLTAGSTDQQRRFRGYEAGAVDFLTKPIETHVLRSKADVFFELWLERHEVARQRDELGAATAENARLLAESLRTAEALKEADRRKDEFLAVLAHELRNPLAPLGNGLQLMRVAGNNPEALAKARDMMERQLGQLVRLVDDLLDISRVTTGKVRLRTEKIRLDEPIRAAVELSRPAIEGGQHEFTIENNDDEVWLEADTTRISQIISNLLTNAAKYTPKGGKIKLKVEKQQSEVVITVSDTGIGIAEDMLPKVFDLFTQVRDSLDRSDGGLGIGLALVKRLAEMHGGSVYAESAGEGKGSSFILRLPRIEPPTEPKMTAEIPSTSSAHQIMIVDDNPDSALSLSMLLGFEGHKTSVVHSGAEALEEAARTRPDVIFLDIGLPGMDGYDVARALRADARYGQPVLVALTGWGSEEHRQRSKEAGFDFHLTKPIEDIQLAKILSEIR